MTDEFNATWKTVQTTPCLAVEAIPGHPMHRYGETLIDAMDAIPSGRLTVSIGGRLCMLRTREELYWFATGLLIALDMTDTEEVIAEEI